MTIEGFFKNEITLYFSGSFGDTSKHTQPILPIFGDFFFAYLLMYYRPSKTTCEMLFQLHKKKPTSHIACSSTTYTNTPYCHLWTGAT